MTTLDEAVERWFDVQMGESDRGFLNGTNIVPYVDKLCSFGYSFPLVEPIRGEDGASIRLWLLNSDISSRRGWASGSNHQAIVRRCAQQTGIPMILLPFSALDLAGINHDTIEPLDVAEERWIDLSHSAQTWADVPRVQQWRWRHAEEVPEGTPGARVATRWADGSSELYWIRDRYKTDLPVYEWTTQQHLMGESIFVATVTMRDSLKRLTHRENVYFWSGFDREEPTGSHYFLCELPIGPWSETPTLENVETFLQPPAVKKAIANGEHVLRQGDIYAIPTRLNITDSKMDSVKGIAVFKRDDREARLFGQRHTATRVALNYSRDGEPPMGRGCLYHEGGEHRRVKLGDGNTWYVFYENLVPHSTEFGRRAWSIVSRGLSVD